MRPLRLHDVAAANLVGSFPALAVADAAAKVGYGRLQAVRPLGADGRRTAGRHRSRCCGHPLASRPACSGGLMFPRVAHVDNGRSGLPLRLLPHAQA